MMPKHGGYILAATHFSMDIASFITLRFAFYTYVLPGLWTPQLLRTFPKACVSNPQFDITHLYMSSLVHFSGRRSLQHPDCPGRNNSHFGLENRVEKCPLSFWYGILPGSFRFQIWCGDFHFWACIRNSVEQAKQLT